MSTPRIVSFRIPAEKVAELDLIAEAMDRDRSYLLNQAVENYLGEQKRFVALIEEGLAASRKGELLDDEDVGVMIDSWIREKATRHRKARARA
jgi:predicted transcriptional regulator